ncbi:MAG: magnesium transporter [Planctomycetota bacterium]
MSTETTTELAAREEDLLNRIRALLEEDDLGGLRDLLQDVPAADVAAVLAELQEPEQVRVFQALDVSGEAGVLGEMSPEDVRSLAEVVPGRVHAAAELMEPDEVADVLDALSHEQAETLLQRFPEEQAAVAEHLRTYPPDSAGGLMTTEFVLLTEEMSARDAIKLTQRSREAETVDDLFVADRQNRLVGTLPLPRLVFAPPEKKVADLMEDLPLAVSPETDQEELLRAATRYNLDAIPVVDDGQVMIGVVTVDDILEVAEEEADEDMYKLAGTGERDPVHASVGRSTRLRLPWLMLSVLDGLFIAFVLSRFEGTLEGVRELKFFIPLIPLMGGQVAIQSSAIMVRALAVGDIRGSTVAGYMRKQAVIALLLAICCGAAVGLLGALIVGAALPVMFAVGLAVGIAVLFAGILGMILPLGFEAVGIDPAVSAGPFITMLNDLFSITIFVLLGMLLAPTGG